MYAVSTLWSDGNHSMTRTATLDLAEHEVDMLKARVLATLARPMDSDPVPVMINIYDDAKWRPVVTVHAHRLGYGQGVHDGIRIADHRNVPTDLPRLTTGVPL